MSAAESCANSCSLRAASGSRLQVRRVQWPLSVQPRYGFARSSQSQRHAFWDQSSASEQEVRATPEPSNGQQRFDGGFGMDEAATARLSRRRYCQACAAPEGRGRRSNLTQPDAPMASRPRRTEDASGLSPGKVQACAGPQRFFQWVRCVWCSGIAGGRLTTSIALPLLGGQGLLEGWTLEGRMLRRLGAIGFSIAFCLLSFIMLRIAC